MLRWGVLGYGNIAKRFIQGLSHSQQGYLYGIASLTPSKKEECLKKHPHIHVYENYEDILNDENIDVIYIALRHNDHYKWSKMALLNGKAVLCEKPATLSSRQTKELCDISQENNIFFMEAMKTRFIPLIHDIKTIINQKVLGDIIRIETSFCSQVPYDEKSYLFDHIQGGALYDVGIYNIAFLLDFIKSSVTDLKIKSVKEYGIDVYNHIELIFENGEKGIIECATNTYVPRQLKIEGTLGILVAEPFYRPIEAKIIYKDGRIETLYKDYQYDDFYGEIEEVHHCIRNKQYQSQRMSHDDSLKAIQLIERIRENEQW